MNVSRVFRRLEGDLLAAGRQLRQGSFTTMRLPRFVPDGGESVRLCDGEQFSAAVDLSTSTLLLRDYRAGIRLQPEDRGKLRHAIRTVHEMKRQGKL